MMNVWFAILTSAFGGVKLVRAKGKFESAAKGADAAYFSAYRCFAYGLNSLFGPNPRS
jgi:hypothetical protein